MTNTEIKYNNSIVFIIIIEQSMNCEKMGQEHNFFFILGIFLHGFYFVWDFFLVIDRIITIVIFSIVIYEIIILNQNYFYSLKFYLFKFVKNLFIFKCDNVIKFFRNHLDLCGDCWVHCCTRIISQILRTWRTVKTYLFHEFLFLPSPSTKLQYIPRNIGGSRIRYELILLSRFDLTIFLHTSHGFLGS